MLCWLVWSAFHGRQTCICSFNFGGTYSLSLRWLLFISQGKGVEPDLKRIAFELIVYDISIESSCSSFRLVSRLFGEEHSVQPLKQMKQNLVVVMGSTIVAIFIMEAILRGIGIPVKLNSGWGWENSAGRKLSKYNALTTNQFGFRGQTIDYHPDDYVVLLVGDSQVEAYAGRPEHMPEQFLQELLASQLHKPVKVFSLASSGWGQDQQLLAIQAYFRDYRADLVLLWATPGNDFWENAFPDRSATPQAGPLKPTFRLIDDELYGPYFTSGSYLHNSAIAQLIETVIANIQQETLEQRILRRWLQEMPSSHKHHKLENEYICEGLTVINQVEFFNTIFDLNNEIGYIVKSGEDFLHSRSHFSPFMIDPSRRDEYLIAVTESLLWHVKKEVEKNKAKFLVFYPVRDDFDKRGLQMVKCVTDSQGNIFRVSLDYISRLRGVISSEDLVVFDLPGGNEIVVSPNDRHLNDLGNELVMKKLSLSLVERSLINR
ncbi:MAG: SGNH/GDSL hydrolase family protein [Nitrospira sp.]|nr:SGNH/GDSL hydrolase family protein [Nitrospira sp.]